MELDCETPGDAVLMRRVPIYGSQDAGRGAYSRMKAVILAASQVSKMRPATYYKWTDAGKSLR